MSMTFPAWLRLKLYFHGINRHPIEVVSEMTFKDLKAISNIMQSGGVEKKRPYLFNTEKPTSFDCALFGHLGRVTLVNNPSLHTCTMNPSAVTILKYVLTKIFN